MRAKSGTILVKKYHFILNRYKKVPLFIEKSGTFSNYEAKKWHFLKEKYHFLYQREVNRC